MMNLSSLIGSIIVMFCAIALAALEAFLPGIGIAGPAALILFCAAVYWCWSTCGAAAAIILMIVGGILTFAAVRRVYRSMQHGKLADSGIFLKTESAPTVQAAPQCSALQRDSVGLTQTALRPSGIAEFDGERVHVTAENGFVEKGVSVTITQINGSHICVAPVSSKRPQ